MNGNVKLSLAVAAMASLSVFAAEMKVDFNRVVGPIKPVNGVGQPPMIGRLGKWQMMHYIKDAGIPYSRLHDVGGTLGSGLFVDVPNIFPNFDADENDPKNYRFAYTDDLIKVLVKNGCEPFFRLGITIENWVADWDGWHALPPLHSTPPKDFAKWARVCEHIARHYLAGWADGFRFKITYWEIWAEADLEPDPARSMTWRGTFDEYCRLYAITAGHLKTCFPAIKVAGPSSCGLYAAQNPMSARGRSKYHYDCVVKFLDYVRDNKLPLDAFTFHSYADPDAVEWQIQSARKLLDERGLVRTETWLDEWLCYPEVKQLGTGRQASGIAAELLMMQNSPVTGACLYDARCRTGAYSPLFNALTQEPHKAYYAFVAFNELTKCGTAVAVTTSGAKGLRVVAAKGKDGAAVMIANPTDRPLPLTVDFGGLKTVSCRVTDDTHTYAETTLPPELAPYSFYLVRFAP